LTLPAIVVFLYTNSIMMEYFSENKSKENARLLFIYIHACLALLLLPRAIVGGILALLKACFPARKLVVSGSSLLLYCS
jgi:nitrogen fixation/metabolism regulation signal transduction histidine kinase